MQEIWLINQWERIAAYDVNTWRVFFVKIICDFIDIKIL